MRQNILSIIILCGLQNLGTAQIFSNLDFEYSVYKGQPRKWAIEGEGRNYSAGVDSIVSKSGRKSLHVAQKDAEVFVFLSIPGNIIAGKDIQIEGYFKSLNSDSLQAKLVFHNPGGGRPIASEPNNAKNRDWQILSNKASFPPNYASDRLLVALMAQGTGEFWFDNVKIRIGDQDYGTGPPDFRHPTKKEVQTLDKNAIPIKSFDVNSPTGDLDQLRNVIGNSTVVAMGENSHGSASIYKLKLRMIKYFAEKEGFSVFALESPTVEADRINEYVLSGKGTVEDVVKNLVYPSWQTQEMIDIVQWIKSYNESAAKKIEFRGFDMQNGSSALEAIREFSKTRDSTLTAKVVDLEKIYKPSPEGDQRQLLIQKAEEIKLHLESGKYHDANPKQLTTIKHYLDIFLQSLSSEGKTRDECMSQNIAWLMDNSGDGVNLLVSADNSHVTKATGKMGYFLEKKYGEMYLNIGFTFKQGSYSAYGSEKYYEVHPPFIGTVEYYLSKSRFQNYFLDIRNISSVDILARPAGFRSIGSRPQETTQFTDTNLKTCFDVIAYFETSTHTNSIVK